MTFSKTLLSHKKIFLSFSTSSFSPFVKCNIRHKNTPLLALNENRAFEVCDVFPVLDRGSQRFRSRNKSLINKLTLVRTERILALGLFFTDFAAIAPYSHE